MACIYNADVQVLNVVFKAYRPITTYFETPHFMTQKMAMNFTFKGMQAVQRAFVIKCLMSGDVNLYHFYITDKDAKKGQDIKILLP